MQNAGLEDHSSHVENLITGLPTVADVESWVGRAGLDDVVSWTENEELAYESGEQFFNSPLITDFLLKNWLASVPELSREEVTQELVRIIDEERYSGAFALTLKATLVVGRKSRA